MSETVDPLDVLTMMFDAPCLLPAQKRVMWTVPCMVEPALAQKRFGAGDLLIALSPIMHRPSYYLVWIDRRWYPEVGYGTDELYEALDSEIWPALEEEFGRRERDDDGPYNWPEVDDEGGCCWRYADADDILSVGLRRQWIPSFDSNWERHPTSCR